MVREITIKDPAKQKQIVLVEQNFMELLDHWSRVCFVGAEDWQWIPFVLSRESGILPDSESAIEFRKQLGITL